MTKFLGSRDKGRKFPKRGEIRMRAKFKATGKYAGFTVDTTGKENKKYILICLAEVFFRRLF